MTLWQVLFVRDKMSLSLFELPNECAIHSRFEGNKRQ